MKYFVTVEGSETEVRVDGEKIGIGGDAVEGHLEHVPGTPVHLVRIGSRVHRVVVRKGDSKGAYALWLDGWRFGVEAVDERTKVIRELTAGTSGPAGPAPIIAPMPGLVVRVTVAVGDSVRAGQGVVVMEAMKMENELRASAQGVVKAVNVVAGRAVEKGMVLVELE